MSRSRYQTRPEDCTLEQLESVGRLYDFIHRIKPVLAQRREALRSAGSPQNQL